MRTILITVILAITSVPAMGQTSVPAPSVFLKDLHGRNVRLADFKGRVVLVNFWATWCPPCRAEIPDLVKWQREYRREGLQVVGVTYPPTNHRAVRTLVRQLKINYPVWLGSKGTKALFDSGETLPFSVVIDREGNVHATIEGIVLPDEFDEKVRPLLGQSSRASAQNAHPDLYVRACFQKLNLLGQG